MNKEESIEILKNLKTEIGEVKEKLKEDDVHRKYSIKLADILEKIDKHAKYSDDVITKLLEIIADMIKYSQKTSALESLAKGKNRSNKNNLYGAEFGYNTEQTSTELILHAIFGKRENITKQDVSNIVTLVDAHNPDLLQYVSVKPNKNNYAVSQLSRILCSIVCNRTDNTLMETYRNFKNTAMFFSPDNDMKNDEVIKWFRNKFTPEALEIIEAKYEK